MSPKHQQVIAFAIGALIGIILGLGFLSFLRLVGGTT